MLTGKAFIEETEIEEAIAAFVWRWIERKPTFSLRALGRKREQKEKPDNGRTP